MDMQPFTAVKKEGFLNLFGALSGSLHMKSPSFFVNLLEREYQQKRALLVNALQQAKFVSTTTDCWSAHQRSFLGMTVHWISEDLVRQSACLVVRRIKGSHTYDVLGRAMEAVHSEFKITERIVETTTDSGSNFIKSFAMFGGKNINEPADIQENDSEDDDDGMVFINVGDIIEEHQAQLLVDEAKQREKELNRVADSADDESQVDGFNFSSDSSDGNKVCSYLFFYRKTISKFSRSYCRRRHRPSSSPPLRLPPLKSCSYR